MSTLVVKVQNFSQVISCCPWSHIHLQSKSHLHCQGTSATCEATDSPLLLQGRMWTSNACYRFSQTTCTKGPTHEQRSEVFTPLNLGEGTSFRNKTLQAPSTKGFVTSPMCRNTTTWKPTARTKHPGPRQDISQLEQLCNVQSPLCSLPHKKQGCVESTWGPWCQELGANVGVCPKLECGLFWGECVKCSEQRSQPVRLWTFRESHWANISHRNLDDVGWRKLLYIWVKPQ